MRTSAQSAIVRVRVARALAGVVIAALGVAGVAKMAAMEEWAHSLRAWSLLPGWSRVVLAVGVPVGEVGVGVAALMGRFSLAVRAAAVLLANFLVVLFAQRFAGPPPACGCYGVIDRYFESLRSFDGSLARAAVLLALVVAALLVAPGRRL